MAASRALRRLLRVLDIQEEQNRAALESALADLHTLQRAQAAAGRREQGGRALVVASAVTGEIVDRLAGIEEALAAARAASVLAVRASGAEENVALCREEFLAKRVERRQAESLVRRAEAADAVDAGRRSQQSLDDWYLNRMHRTRSSRGAKE